MCVCVSQIVCVSRITRGTAAASRVGHPCCRFVTERVQTGPRPAPPPACAPRAPRLTWLPLLPSRHIREQNRQRNHWPQRLPAPCALGASAAGRVGHPGCHYNTETCRQRSGPPHHPSPRTLCSRYIWRRQSLATQLLPVQQITQVQRQQERSSRLPERLPAHLVLPVHLPPHRGLPQHLGGALAVAAVHSQQHGSAARRRAGGGAAGGWARAGREPAEGAPRGPAPPAHSRPKRPALAAAPARTRPPLREPSPRLRLQPRPAAGPPPRVAPAALSGYARRSPECRRDLGVQLLPHFGGATHQDQILGVLRRWVDTCI